MVAPGGRRWGRRGRNPFSAVSRAKPVLADFGTLRVDFDRVRPAFTTHQADVDACHRVGGLFSAEHDPGGAGATTAERGRKLHVLIRLREQQPSTCRRFGRPDDLAVFGPPVSLTHGMEAREGRTGECPIRHEVPGTAGQRSGQCEREQREHNRRLSKHLFLRALAANGGLIMVRFFRYTAATPTYNS